MHLQLSCHPQTSFDTLKLSTNLAGLQSLRALHIVILDFKDLYFLTIVLDSLSVV